MADASTPDTLTTPTWLKWSLRLLPFVGALVGPFTVGGEGPWYVKSVSGFLIGLAFAFVGWKGQHVPPISTVFTGAAALLLLAGLFVAFAFSSAATIGSVIVATLAAGAFYWGLSRM